MDVGGLLVDGVFRTLVGTSVGGSDAIWGKKILFVPPARVDFITFRLNAAATKADGRDNTEVIPVPRSE